jgi:hypothetical protein
MTIDDAIADLKSKILAACAAAEIRVMRVSDEEARLSVYAPAGAIAAIQDATRELTILLMTVEGLDVQVFAYDLSTNTPPAP